MTPCVAAKHLGKKVFENFFTIIIHRYGCYLC